jgi:hypothetical protein
MKSLTELDGSIRRTPCHSLEGAQKCAKVTKQRGEEALGRWKDGKMDAIRVHGAFASISRNFVASRLFWFGGL